MAGHGRVGWHHPRHDGDEPSGARQTSWGPLLWNRPWLIAAGAALGAAAAAVVPTSASAAEVSPAGHRHRDRFETRIQVAPGVHVSVADLDGGRRGTIVLIPGWPLSSTMLENTTLFLADQGYRAVALDLRGFGKSDGDRPMESGKVKSAAVAARDSRGALVAVGVTLGFAG